MYTMKFDERFKEKILQGKKTWTSRPKEKPIKEGDIFKAKFVTEEGVALDEELYMVCIDKKSDSVKDIARFYHNECGFEEEFDLILYLLGVYGRDTFEGKSGYLEFYLYNFIVLENPNELFKEELKGMVKED